MSDFRPCPNCGEQVGIYARACVCGWQADGTKRVGKAAFNMERAEKAAYNMVCTWNYGGLSCRYPVGLFLDGARSGLCLFHRQRAKGPMAAAVAEESHNCTQEQYHERASRALYSIEPPGIRKLRDRLKRVAGGETVGILASRLLPEREPGADECEDRAN